MKAMYVYNLKQALFFIKNGVTVDDIGISKGKVYHKFYRTQEFEDAFSKWCSERNKINAI